jgi:vesicle coat complex subunit
MPSIPRIVLSILSCLALVAALPAQNPAPGMPKETSPPTQIAGRSLDEWIKLLGDADPSNRDAAVRIIPLFGKPAEAKAIPKITSLVVNDPDATVRVNALICVTTIPIDDPKLIKGIVTNVQTQMKSGQTSMRIQATLAAGRLGKHAKPLLGSVVEALRDQSSYEVRRAAADALSSVGRNDNEFPDQHALDALVGAMGDTSLVVRVAVVRSLVMLGPPSSMEKADGERKSLIRRVDPKSALREPDPALQLWIRACVMRLDSVLLNPGINLAPEAKKSHDDAAKRFKEYLDIVASKLGDDKLRITAAEALAGVGPGALPKLPELLIGLKDDKQENYQFMVSCLFAIGELGPAANPQAGPEVRKLLMNSNPIIKYFAEQALKKLTGQKN